MLCAQRAFAYALGITQRLARMNKYTAASNVMRVRNHQPTRLENFVDAAFAFAVTLVVVSIGHVPNSVPQMLQALRGMPTFAVCILLITRIWNAHREWSRHYGLEDALALRLSIALVFVMLVYVYPLRLLFALMFAWISNGWLMDQPVDLQNFDELRAAFVVYGIGFCAVALLFVALHRHALRLHATLQLDPAEILHTRMTIAIWVAVAGVSLLSVVGAMTIPFSSVHSPLLAAPGLLYLLIAPALRLVRRHYGARIAALSEQAPGA